MTVAVALVGISGAQTQAPAREALHLTSEEASALGRSLTRSRGEAVVLSTCNRTEIYVAAADIAETLQRARRALIRLDPHSVPESALYAYGGQAAAAHLFRVAAGMESIVLGDIHVAAQVRRAYEAARSAGTTGPLLDRLFQAASAACKRVRSQTSLSTGSTSIPAIAIATAGRVAAPLSDRHLLIIGVGRIAKAAALNAASRGCREIVVANRSFARAQELAAGLSARAAPLGELSAELTAADVVVTAAGGHDFILTAEHAAAARQRPSGRPLVLFDLGLPRNIDPMFDDLPHAQLFNLDDLARIAASNQDRRQADLQLADAIVLDAAERYAAWHGRRAVAPAILAIHDDAEDTRQFILARHAARLARLTTADRSLVEAITRQLVTKLVHGPTVELRRQMLERSR